MSILESIRKRTGLLVGIIGLALVIFILESLLGSGSSIFGGGDTTVGEVNGKAIDRNEFYTKVENQLNMVRQNKQTNDIDAETRKQVIDYVFQSYISDNVIKPQYNKLGLSVSEDELYENMIVNPVQAIIQRLTDQNTGKIYEQMARPDGSLDQNKFRQFVTGSTGDMELFVKQMEEDVTNTRLAEKYSNLIHKAIYVTNAEAKSNFETQNNKLDVSFVMKRYDAVDDATVKLSDDELKKYYNENKYKYSNKIASRKIEYVAFAILPSQSDVDAIEKNAQLVAEGFKSKTASEDSAYMMAESEAGNIIVQDFTRKTMIVRDSSVFTSPIGSVFGPYNEGAYIKIYKLQQIRSIADSAKVRHILIGTMDMQTNQPKRTRERAKAIADSLIVLIKSKAVTFDTLVKTISDDLGSVDKGGDYGWFDDTKNFVEPFKNAGLLGKKGDLNAVETQFGYHIIEVLDVSAARHDAYRMAQIFKMITPSEETNKEIFDKAKQFAGENTTGDLFDKAVEAQKLTKRLADNITENDFTIPGLDNAKELVKWSYTASKGDVNLFTFNDKHLVVKLSSIKEKGTLPLEEVKDQVTVEATQRKKAEMFVAEFNAKAANVTDINTVAQKMGLEAINQDNLSPESHNVKGIGHDDVLVGTAAGLKKGAMSRVTAGEVGVFVLKLNNVVLSPTPLDVKMQKMQMEQMLTYRADGEFYSALKEKANIENHVGRFE